jgi:hypothetical protein
MRLSRTVTLAVLLAVTPAGAQSPTLKTGPLELSLGGRVQTQFSTSSVDTVPVQDWMLRRVRLETAVRFGETAGGKLQVEFAGNRVVLKDAYMRLSLDPALNVLAGQAHRPFGLMTQTSSALMAPIERGVRVRGLERAREHYELVSGLGYSERDVGVQLNGRLPLPLAPFYAAAFTNGPMHLVHGGERSYQLTARAGFRPLKGLAVAGSWGRRDFVRAATDSAPALSRAGHAWAVDAEVGGYRPGLHLIGELAFGDEDPLEEHHFLGAQGWLSYRARTLEPLLRVSYGDTRGGGTLVTPGVNVYFGGMNRVMLNLDVWNGAQTAQSLKAQFQMAF